MERLWKKWSSEEIIKLVKGIHEDKLHNSIQKLLSNNVAINVNIFGPFMKHEIGSYVECTLAIEKENWNFGRLDVHVLEQIRIHWSAHVTATKVWNSASEEDQEIAFCFLVRHEMR